MTEAMGDDDVRPGVRQHVVGDSADGEGAQDFVCFDLTTRLYFRAPVTISHCLRHCLLCCEQYFGSGRVLNQTDWLDLVIVLYCSSRRQ